MAVEDRSQEKAHANTAPMGTAHVCTRAVHLPVRVCGGTTLEVVPPRTQMGRQMAQTRTWVVPVRAHVHVCFFLCDKTLDVG